MAVKHKLEHIQPIALELWQTLKPYCKKIKIAGSIRRQQPTCKDIELVLIPNDNSARNKIGAFFLSNGAIRKGQFSGRYVQCFYQGYFVDLFMPQEHDYYRQLAIRTGSAEFAKRLASAWKKKGYVGSKYGLIEDGLQASESPEFLTPMSWDSEKDFFSWLDIEWTEPKDRL